MKRLVIDIETVGTPWDEHPPYVREYLLKGKNEAEAEEEKRRGALSPFLGQIVTIGVINADDGRSCALYVVPGQEELLTEKDGLRTFISGSEKLILEKFWDFLGRDDRFISFNGRQFDGPFLMLRSAIHGIRPKRDLVGYRYSFHPNCDLREVLNFWGSLNPRQIRFNLDLACRAFGVTSSKSDQMDGRAVESLFRAGRYREIADYCLEDVRATSELYLKLASTILVWENNFRDAEARDQRSQKEEIRETPAALPSEETFIESLTAGSAELAASLDRLEVAASDTPMFAGKHPAMLLEKLIKTEEADDLLSEIDPT